MGIVAKIKNKAIVTALLAVILGMVLLNNLHEQNNDAKINSAIATIYDDRLVVEGYIFNYAHHLQQIVEISGNIPADRQRLTGHLSEINKLNALYIKTRLTESEKDNFEQFVMSCNKITPALERNNYSKAIFFAKKAKDILPVLSDIQIQEASSQMHSLKKLFGANSISSQFEIGILVIITFLILALQFTGNIVKAGHFPKSPSLN